jgi:hypothetical protein
MLGTSSENLGKKQYEAQQGRIKDDGDNSEAKKLENEKFFNDYIQRVQNRIESVESLSELNSLLIIYRHELDSKFPDREQGNAILDYDKTRILTKVRIEGKLYSIYLLDNKQLIPVKEVHKILTEGTN